MTRARFDWFRLLAWVPAVTWVAMWSYVSRFEGWGRWGAAPLLLVPVVLSLPITIVGLLRLRSERAGAGVAPGTVASTAIAALPLVWLLWRFLITR